MNIPDCPPDLSFPPLAACQEDFEFSFLAKTQALGPHVAKKWGWDEQFQRNIHERRVREKPFFAIRSRGKSIGTLSLQLQLGHIRFGEFYLLDQFRGHGIGSKVLRHCLRIADERGFPVRLEYLQWNPVGSLYRRNGFIETGRSESHYLMERPLADRS